MCSGISRLISYKPIFSEIMKPITYTLSIVATVLSLIACNGAKQGETPRSFIVAGQVFNIPEGCSQTLIINECDPSPISKRAVIEFDSLGRFHEVMPISFGHTFSVNYARQFVQAYAAPGDSIYIEIDASSVPITFQLSGDNAGLNNEFAHAMIDLTDYFWNVKLPADSMAFDQYMQAFKAEAEQMSNMIADYATEHSLSEDATGLLKTDGLYSLANMAVDYEGNGDDDRMAFFTDTLFDIYNDENARSMMFSYHLSALAHHIPEQIEKMPKGLVRDIMYAAMSDEIKPEREAFADTIYYDRLYADNGTTIEVGNISHDDIVVYDGDTVYTVSGVNPLEWLTDEYSGRPIYLDISAVWCGPCRAGLESSNGLREHFKNTDVVFAVIWLRSDLERWKEYVPSITDAVHIFINNEDTSNMIMGRFGMRGFPSYYLIDNDKTIRTDAPAYHSPDLPDYLKQFSN